MCAPCTSRDRVREAVLQQQNGARPAAAAWFGPDSNILADISIVPSVRCLARASARGCAAVGDSLDDQLVDNCAQGLRRR
jgi:hypothetical protein